MNTDGHGKTKQKKETNVDGKRKTDTATSTRHIERDETHDMTKRRNHTGLHTSDKKGLTEWVFEE
jgi:hypothetical protein